MKKILFAVFSSILLLTLFSCKPSGEVVTNVVTNDQPGLQGQPWANSNIYGNWPGTRPAPEDHFELYVNYDLYMKDLREEIKTDSFYQQSEDFQESKIKELIADLSKTSDELELIRAYYGLFADFDKRNSEGNGPVIYYRDMIIGNRTVEELSLEIRKGLVFGNPFAVFSVDKVPYGSDKYGVRIDFNLPLSSMLKPGYSDQELYEAKEKLVSLLTLADYEESYARTVVDMIEEYEIQAYNLDGEFMEKYSIESDEIIMSLDEIQDFCEPLYDLAVGLGYCSFEDPVLYSIENAGMFYGIGQMYNDENIDIIHAIYVLAMTEYARSFIDMDSYAQAAGIAPEEIDIEEISFRFINDYLSAAVDQVYLEFVFPEGLREKIINLTEMYIEAMGQRLMNETWLSDATKQKALEKLENMVCVVVYPDRWIDFSELRDIVQDHDQFLLDAVLCRDDFYREYETSFLGKDVERGNWVFSNTKSTEANAYYIQSENSINILAGILNDSLYIDNSIETILGSIGATIGHEITHGFDTEGAKYNSVGDMEDWWTEEDAANFEQRAKLIADAMSRISVSDGYDVSGEYVLDEMVADLGGVALSLDIAGQYPDFDYDEFFRTYALMWYKVLPDVDSALDSYFEDTHPADYIRANFVVQMFDEFYKTYPQVTEGTAMYRSPEERLSVW